jgi:hypothetical protein
MIFVSHAVRDKPVVDAFVTLLSAGANVRTEEIFCSSSPGSDIDPGDEFVRTIHAALKAADLVILFITPNYYDSVFCVAEMGGAWALEKKVFPLLTSDVGREIGHNMLGRQTERIDRRGLNSLFERIRAEMSPRKWNANLFEDHRDLFLSNYATEYLAVPKPEKVALSDFEREQSRADAALEQMRVAEGEIARARAQIAHLEAAKDSADVARIRQAFVSTDRERWYELVASAHAALKKLGAPERRAVFASFTGEPWRPSTETQDYWSPELPRAIAGERIVRADAYANWGFFASSNHPFLKPAFRALTAIGEFLSSGLTNELRNELEEEYEAPISLENLDFWEAVLLDDPLIE